jgi:hypothetical protein
VQDCVLETYKGVFNIRKGGPPITSLLMLCRIRQSSRISVDGLFRLTYVLGDSLIFSAGHAHKDPEIYPEPEKYKYDRFLRDPVSNEPPRFVKDGHKLSASMFMFSEGSSPGLFLGNPKLTLN